MSLASATASRVYQQLEKTRKEYQFRKLTGEANRLYRQGLKPFHRYPAAVCICGEGMGVEEDKLKLKKVPPRRGYSSQVLVFNSNLITSLNQS